MLAGLISDTHGMLRPEALRALDGVSLILHAGDVGGTSILERLGRIAPVHAVGGNVDPAGAKTTLGEAARILRAASVAYCAMTAPECSGDWPRTRNVRQSLEYAL